MSSSKLKALIILIVLVMYIGIGVYPIMPKLMKENTITINAGEGLVLQGDASKVEWESSAPITFTVRESILTGLSSPIYNVTSTSGEYTLLEYYGTWNFVWENYGETTVTVKYRLYSGIGASQLGWLAGATIVFIIAIICIIKAPVKRRELTPGEIKVVYHYHGWDRPRLGDRKFGRR